MKMKRALVVGATGGTGAVITASSKPVLGPCWLKNLDRLWNLGPIISEKQLL